MSWTLNRIRAGFEQLYYRDYRYRKDGRRSMAALGYDLVPDDEIADSPFEIEDDKGIGDWPRRFIHGVVCKSTGVRTFTTPRRPRLERITRLVDEEGFFAKVSLCEHQLSMSDASKIAAPKGFNRYADQRITSGAIWGDFICSETSDNEALYSLLIWHHIAGENFMRVREITMKFIRGQQEPSHAFEVRVKSLCNAHYSVRDYFGAVGVLFGSVFSADAEIFRISSFGFNNKGHRIESFSAVDRRAGSNLQYRLLQSPNDIDLALAIQRKIDEDASVFTAA